MKIHIILLSLIFIWFPIVVWGSGVSITEIMYDAEATDAGREWIEIYNNSGAEIDLSKYKLVEANSSHSIVPIQGDGVLPDKSFAIIADNPEIFNSVYSSVTKSRIYDASFSLTNNTGEYIGLKDQDGNILFEVTYNTSIGGNGDGKSLQYDGTKWISALPSVLSFTTSSVLDNKNQNNTQPGVVDDFKLNPKKDSVIHFVFDTPKNVLVGTRNEFRATLYSAGGDQITNGRFVWNFGDGEILEQNNLMPVYHSYVYPGTYTITCDYKYSWYEKSIVIGKSSISVVRSPFEIGEFYNLPSPAIQVVNTSSSEYSLSGYVVKSNVGNFKIPENTYLGGKDEIVIRLPAGNYDANTFALVDPYNTNVSSFTNKTLVMSPVFSKQTYLDNDLLAINQPQVFEESPVVNLSQDNKIISLESTKKNSNNIVSYLILCFIIMVAGASIIFLKKNNIDKDLESDDYTLQDE